jgi:hypothetical protein
MKPHRHYQQYWADANQCNQRNPKIKESLKKVLIHVFVKVTG